MSILDTEETKLFVASVVMLCWLIFMYMFICSNNWSETE